MRKCTCIYWDSKKREHVKEEGFFHCFAAYFEEFENGPGNGTTALVELVNGHVVNSEPHDIVFLEAPCES